MLLLLIRLLFISHLALSQSNQDRANNDANEGALKLIANIPRSGGDDTLDKDDFSEDGEKYWIGIVSLVAIPFVFVGLSMFLCPFWTICRCCQCCCCKKKKPKNEITKCQIYTPFFIVIAFLIVIVTMAALAYGANVDFSGALLHNEGEGEDGNLFSVAEDLTNDAAIKMNAILNITTDIRAHIISAIDGVQNILNDTSILSTGSTALIAMLNDISNLWDNYNVSATGPNNDTYVFSCEFCTTFSDQVANISTQIEDQTGPIFQDLNSTLTAVDSSLVEVESAILQSIDDFLEEITEVRDDADDNKNDVVDFRPDAEDYDDMRKLSYNILFVIPLLPIIFVLIGGILKKSVCFSIAYILMWCSCTLMWLLLAIHLPIAVLLNDSCKFLDVVDQNVTATFNNSAGEILQACLNNDRLVETLGLSGDLNFTNEITFPSLGNITQNFQFSSLLSFDSDAQAMNFTTFYKAGDDALSVINNLTLNSPNTALNSLARHYTRDNISALTSTDYYTSATTPEITLDDLKNLLLAENSSITAFTLVVTQIQSNLTSVSDLVASIENSTQILVNRVDNASVLLNPLFDSVDDLIDTARCGFIGDAYYDTKAVMCSSVLGALSRIVVSMFVIAILSLFSCCITVKLVRKVEWFQLQKKEDKERKLQQSFQPNQPTIVVMQPPGINGQQPGNQAMYYNSNKI